MADVHQSDAHLRLAHSLLEQFAVGNFTMRQYKILLFILRLSWGCGKKFAVIPHRSEWNQIGIGHQHISRELAILVRDKVLVVNEAGTRFSLNKDYDGWRMGRAAGYDPASLKALVAHNIELYTQTPDKTAEEEALRTGNIEDIEIVTIWKSVGSMRLNEAKCYELVTELRTEFPLVDILAESKKWKQFKKDHPLKMNSAPAKQLWNWMGFARDGFAKSRTSRLSGGTARGVTHDED